MAANAQTNTRVTNHDGATRATPMQRGLQTTTTYIPEFDLNQYSIKFRECLPANASSLAESSIRHGSVLIHMCNGTNGCGDSCVANYDEYEIDLDLYLSTTVAYFKQQRDAMCSACQIMCEPDDDTIAVAGVNGDETAGRRLVVAEQQDFLDCDTCYNECEKIENMEANGYYDATNFLQCQMIYDPTDDIEGNLYAGPMCSDSGAKITIGVFTDKNCLELDTTKQVDDYMVNSDGVQMMLSHALLKNTYRDTCISCTDGPDVNVTMMTGLDVCQTLYNESSVRAISRSPLAGASRAGATSGVTWTFGATLLLMVVGSLTL